MSTTEKPRLWAIIELFGHQKIAGEISEQTFGGAAMVRVDVPAVAYEEAAWERSNAGSIEVKRTREIAPHTRSFGPAAIYSINWVDEITARAAAHSIRHEPVAPYSVRDALRNMPPADKLRLIGSNGSELFDDDDRPF